MSKKTEKPYSHPRWTEIPQAEVVGHVDISEEEREEASKGFYEFIERDQERRRKRKKQAGTGN